MSLPPEVRRKGAWGLGLLGESKEFKLYPPSEFPGLFAVAKFYETCLYLIDFMGPRLMRLEIMNDQAVGRPEERAFISTDTAMDD